MKNSANQKPKDSKGKSAASARRVSPARIAAYEILLKIETERAFSSILLPQYEKNLAANDRALCHELTLGVLRKQIYLDALVQKLVSKPLEKFDREILIVLRIGAFQLFFLDKVPDFAAINEAVNLAHRAGKKSAAGLVNAVLRKLQRETPELAFKDETEEISVLTSHPRWLIEYWKQSFGIKTARDVAEANNRPPKMAFRLTRKSSSQTIEILEKLGAKISPSEIVKDAWTIEKAHEYLFLYAEEGKIYFQDEGSQLVGQTADLKPGERFLDVCAAPGSKTTLIAKESNENAKIIAGDKYFQRVQMLAQTIKRVSAQAVKTIVYDAERSLPFKDETFNCALIDAPCSGTGTIRHNPEIRYFLREEDFAELSAKQLKILKNASKAISLGGRLIYSTCSLERAENEAVIEKFLTENSSFEKFELKVSAKFLTEDGFARTFPPRDLTDGFFIAGLKRVG